MVTKTNDTAPDMNTKSTFNIRMAMTTSHSYGTHAVTFVFECFASLTAAKAYRNLTVKAVQYPAFHCINL